MGGRSMMLKVSEDKIEKGYIPIFAPPGGTDRLDSLRVPSSI